MVGKLEELVTIWNIIPVRLASFWVSELRHTKSMDVFKSALHQIKLKKDQKEKEASWSNAWFQGQEKYKLSLRHSIMPRVNIQK